MQQGKAKAALMDADKAVSLDADDPETVNTRAHILEALGRKKEAIAEYRKALGLRLRNPESAAHKDSEDSLRRLGVKP
jgi:Flp pilus assembly protein TadD